MRTRVWCEEGCWKLYLVVGLEHRSWQLGSIEISFRKMSGQESFRCLSWSSININKLYNVLMIHDSNSIDLYKCIYLSYDLDSDSPMFLNLTKIFCHFFFWRLHILLKPIFRKQKEHETNRSLENSSDPHNVDGKFRSYRTNVLHGTNGIFTYIQESTNRTHWRDPKKPEYLYYNIIALVTCLGVRW